MSQYFAVNLNLYVYFLSLISLYHDIVVKKLNLLMTNSNKRQKLPLNTSSELDGWTEGQTYGQMDGQK